MSGAVTPEMTHIGAQELLRSGLLRPGVDMDTDAVGLMVCASRMFMAMDRARPKNMTREGEIFDPAKLGRKVIL